MTRVKRGVVTRRKHKKLLGMAKGYEMSRSSRLSVAKETILHAGEYAFAGRRKRKGDFRRTWIVRINAALRTMDMTYSSFIALMKKKNIGLDRKILSTLAQNEQIFKNVVDAVKKQK